MEFHPVTLADRDAYQAVSLKAGRRNCNFTFANIIGWQFWFGTEVSILPDALVLRFSLDGRRAYMVCTGGTPPCGLLCELCADAGGELMLLGLEDDVAMALRDAGAAAGVEVAVEPRRNQCDYIYLRTDLATLAGGKLKGKRNHVNRFLAEHPDFEYRALEPSMFDDCRRLEALWRAEHDSADSTGSDTVDAEQRVIETVFAHWDELGMIGGSIFLEGRMVAFTYGSAVTEDTIDVCVEKADRNINGLFSAINQQFAAHLPERFVYVNREEDMGLPGLRKAKLSYHPHILLSYNVLHAK